MTTTQQQIDALLRSKLQDSDIEAVDQLIITVCASACELEAARQQNGIPPTIPAPWPASTWNFQSLWSRVHHAA